MSDFDSANNLNDLDVATPNELATMEELVASIRQIKAVLKNVLLTSLTPQGVLKTDAVKSVGADTIGVEQLKANAVTEVKIADNAIVESKIKDAEISGDKLKDGALVERLFAEASIPTSAFKPNSIPLSAFNELVKKEYIASSPDDDSLRAISSEAIKNEAIVDRCVKDVGVGKLTGGDDDMFLVRVAGVWTPVALNGGFTYNSETGLIDVASGVGFVVIADAKARGTDGGAGVTATWITRSIGEVADPSGLLSISSNFLTLQPGTYFVNIKCPAYGVGKHQARLLLLAEQLVPIWGTSEVAGTGICTHSVICGVLVVDEVKTYVIQHWIEATNGSSDLGKASGSYNDSKTNHSEIYTNGFIFKLI